MQEEWEAALLSMEQRECQLRVEVDEWKEALETERQANGKLREQLQHQSSELERRTAVIAEKQAETLKSANDPLRAAATAPRACLDLDTAC